MAASLGGSWVSSLRRGLVSRDGDGRSAQSLFQAHRTA